MPEHRPPRLLHLYLGVVLVYLTVVYLGALHVKYERRRLSRAAASTSPRPAPRRLGARSR